MRGVSSGTLGGLSAKSRSDGRSGKIRKPDGFYALSSYPLDRHSETWVTPLGAGSSRGLGDHLGSSLSSLLWALTAAHSKRYCTSQDPVPKYLDRIARQGLVTGDDVPTGAFRGYQIAI